MKQNILLVFSLFLFSAIGAQNIEFDVSPVVTMNIAASDFEGVCHSTVSNTASDQRGFRWDKVIVEATDGWTVAVCSPVQCYAPNVNTEDFVLAAGTGGTLDVHAYPNMTEGSAIVEVVITDMADENLSVSNMYYFNASPTSTTDIAAASVKVYPNPSNGLFTIKGDLQLDHVEILNLAGQRVKNFEFGDGQWYNISELPRGTYLVRLVDRNAQTVTTKLMNKL